MPQILGVDPKHIEGVERRICGSIITGMRMRILPNPQNLKDAVRCVIESNSADGYVPSRFIQATGDGNAPDLLAVCRRLINAGETMQRLDSALKRISTLLTLEDLVSWRGAEWGFDDATIDIARDRSVYFDQVAGRSRYRVPGDK